MAVEVAVETAVEFQNGCRKKSGSRKAPHLDSGIPLFEKLMNIFKSQAITEDFQTGNSSR